MVWFKSNFQRNDQFVYQFVYFKGITYLPYSTLCCGHNPRLFRILSMSVCISLPYMNAVPEVDGNKPVNSDMVVVLPAPL